MRCPESCSCSAKLFEDKFYLVLINIVIDYRAKDSIVSIRICGCQRKFSPLWKISDDNIMQVPI